MAWCPNLLSWGRGFTYLIGVNPLQKGPIASILNAQVVVTNPEGREFEGAIEDASSSYLDVRFATDHRGQFSETKRFRRKNLRGYENDWTVRESADVMATA